jgi:DNA-binding LacI/PurR family transcriptional regulator
MVSLSAQQVVRLGEARGTQRMRTKVTLGDVARRAGVSPSTAARVIHDSGYVSEENRKRVSEAVSSLSYRPNLAARILRTHRSKTLGLVLTDAKATPFYTQVAQAMQREAAARGYTLLSFFHTWSAETEREGISRLLEYRVDAILLCRALDPGNVLRIADANVPLVQVERSIAEVGDVILVDSRESMIQAVAALKAAGHNNIAFLGSRPKKIGVSTLEGLDAETERIASFRHAVAVAGEPLRAGHIGLGSYDMDFGVPLEGARLMAEMLDKQGDLPTAAIMGSDVMAAGALQTLRERGIRVPRDFSIVGFDDSVAAILAPAVSTIAQPIKELARSAVEIAVSRAEGDTGPKRVAIHSASFIRRDSIGQLGAISE